MKVKSIIAMVLLTLVSVGGIAQSPVKQSSAGAIAQSPVKQSSVGAIAQSAVKQSSAGAVAQTAVGAYEQATVAQSAVGSVSKKEQITEPAAHSPNATELTQQQQEDNAAAAAKSMAKSSRGKITEGVSPKAMMYFTHKCNSKYDTQMTLNRVGNLYKLMPRKLKREIGQIYYPALREGLQADDEMKFLEADARKKVLEDGTLQIELSFPKFFLTLDHVSWADLDQLFLTYFKR